MFGLTAHINQNKVYVGDAERGRTHRIQDPSAMMCPLWTGSDLTGRGVCENSFYTKMEGCNTAEDRVFVENNLRPQYTNFVTVSAAGISGDGLYRTNSQAYGANMRTAEKKQTLSSTPHFGGIDNSQIKSTNTYEEVKGALSAHSQDRIAATSQQSRIRQASAVGHQSSMRSNFPSQSILPNPAGDYQPHTAGGQYVRLSAYTSGTR